MRIVRGVAGVAPAAIIVALALAGCFDVSQTVTLNRDLSGKAAVDMTVDMEGMVRVMAEMKKQMTGGAGPLTDEELEAAKKEFLEEQEAKAEGEDPEAQKAKIEEKLPEGVELVEFDIKKDGLKLVFHAVFSFDHISKLSQIQTEEGEGKTIPTGPKNPVAKPFGNLKYVDEGETFLLTNEPPNPADREEPPAGGPGDNPEMKKQIEAAMAGTKVSFRIDSPFEVVEHNATRVEGTVLIWEYDYGTLAAASKDGGAAVGIRARFKK